MEKPPADIFGDKLFDKWAMCECIALIFFCRDLSEPHRDLSGNETYMALPLMLAGDLWEGSMLLTIPLIYKFAKTFYSILLSKV